MLRMIILLLTLLMTTHTYAQQISVEKPEFPIIDWTSKNTNDEVSIQNGMGIPVIVHINVTKPAENASGVSISNCGTTRHINAGSSAICLSTSPTNAITITSDSSEIPAVGTYQITRQ